MDEMATSNVEVESNADSCEQELEPEEDIAVADVISCFIALRSAAPERIIELCDQLDHDDSVSVNELKNIIEQFAATERNSVTNDCDDKVSDDSRFLNSTGNLEGCGGDVSAISIVEHDVGELLLRNKSISHNNFNLRRENADLRKQLEICDEESDAHRQRISELEKDLRQIQGNKSDIQELLMEKDEVQSQNLKLQEEIKNHVNREKVIKEETDDYRKTLSDLHDKYDILFCQLENEKLKNDNLRDDFNLMQVKYEDYQYRMEKDKEVNSMQTKQIAELQEKLSQYEYECEALKEQNKVLNDQMRESLLEKSFSERQLINTGTDLVKTSIEYELNSADMSLDSEHTQSPLCGTSNRKSRRIRSDFYLTEAIKNNIFTFNSVPSSPKRLFDVTLGNDVFPRLLRCGKCDFGVQTVDVMTSNSSAQTQCQSDSISHDEVDHKQCLDSIDEENEAFIEASALIQEDLQCKIAEISDMKTSLESLQNDLKTERSCSQHWKELAEKCCSGMESLREELDAEQEKVLHLSEMNWKICSSQLDTWYDKYIERIDRVCDEESADRGEHSLSMWPSPSRLIESLCLVRDFPKTVTTDDKIQLLGQGQGLSMGDLQNDEAAVCELIQSHDLDATTYQGRMNMLKICRGLTAEALSKKCHGLLQFISQCEYSDLMVPDYAEKAISSIQALALKTCGLEKCIGAREEEMKSRSIIEILKNFIKSHESRCGEVRLRKLDDSVDCMSKPGKMVDRPDEMILPLTEPNNRQCLPVADNAPCRESDVDEMLEQFLESKISKWQKVLLGTGLMTYLTTWFVPSKYRLMVVIFLLCTVMTFRPYDYRVPSVI